MRARRGRACLEVGLRFAAQYLGTRQQKTAGRAGGFMVLGGQSREGSLGIPAAAGAAGLLANGLAGDGADVMASDAEVGEFAVRHAAEFGDGLAILDPVVVSACKVHVRFLVCERRSGWTLP